MSQQCQWLATLCCRKAIANKDSSNLLHPRHAEYGFKKREIRSTVDWTVSQPLLNEWLYYTQRGKGSGEKCGFEHFTCIQASRGIRAEPITKFIATSLPRIDNSPHYGRRQLWSVKRGGLYLTSTLSNFAGPLWLSGLNHWLGYSACWPDGLMALAGLGSNPGLEGSFSARLG